MLLYPWSFLIDSPADCFRVSSEQSPLPSLLGVRCIHMCGKGVAMYISPLHPQSSPGLFTSLIHQSSSGFCVPCFLFVCLLVFMYLMVGTNFQQSFIRLAFVKLHMLFGKKENHIMFILHTEMLQAFTRACEETLG